MVNRRLRIYYGPEDIHAATGTANACTAGQQDQQRVSVPLREILDTLVEAVVRRRGWVHDFEEDEVSISTDLYEVILAYQHYQRPSAS